MTTTRDKRQWGYFERFSENDSNAYKNKSYGNGAFSASLWSGRMLMTIVAARYENREIKFKDYVHVIEPNFFLYDALWTISAVVLDLCAQAGIFRPIFSC